MLNFHPRPFPAAVGDSNLDNWGSQAASDQSQLRDVSRVLSPEVLKRVGKLARRRGLTEEETAFYMDKVAGRVRLLDQMLISKGAHLQQATHDQLALRFCMRPGADRNLAATLDILKSFILEARDSKLSPELTRSLKTLAINQISLSPVSRNAALSTCLKKMLGGRLAAFKRWNEVTLLNEPVSRWVCNESKFAPMPQVVSSWFDALKEDVPAALIAAGMGVPEKLMERVWQTFHPGSPEMALIFETYSIYSRPSPQQAIMAYASLKADWLDAEDRQNRRRVRAGDS